MLEIVHVSVPEEDEKRYKDFWKYTKTINVSWIQAYKYCPYQLYLSRVKKIKVPATRSMLAGTAAHAELEEEHKKQVVQELSVEEALQLAETERKAYVYRELFIIVHFDNYQLLSKMDELDIYPDHIEIIEDKKSEKAYEGQIYQVYGYAYAFKHMFNVDKKIKVYLRSHSSGELIYDEDFGEEQEEKIKHTLDDMLALLKSTEPPTMEPELWKCKGCNYKEVCELYQERVKNENANKGR